MLQLAIETMKHSKYKSLGRFLPLVIHRHEHCGVRVSMLAISSHPHWGYVHLEMLMVAVMAFELLLPLTIV